MQKFISLIGAAILGGLIALGAFQLIPNNQKFAEGPQAFVKQANNLNTSPSLNLPTDFVVAAEKASDAVVHIKALIDPSATTQQRGGGQNPFEEFFEYFGQVPDQGPRAGSGSGVIFSRDGYIVTNNHVINGAQDIEVTLSDNRIFSAELIGKDPNTDLAVLKIDETQLPTIELGDSDELKVGEWVLAVGNPFGYLTSTVTAGIVSAKGRNIRLLREKYAIESFIQTDAAVNPGNSGGALVDTDGRLVGINTAIATQSGVFSGYSFAIPVDIVIKIVDDLIEFGEVKRGFLGINIQDLDSERADELGINISQGVYVDSVIDGSSAQYAGVLPQDVITRVDGRKINKVSELQEFVGRSKVGDVLNVTINRKGKMKDIPVKLRPPQG